MRILIKTIIVSLGILVCFAGFVFLINSSLFDKELKSELVALMEKPGRNVPGLENAYLFLMGFNAEENINPHAAGTSYTNAIQSIINENYMAEFPADFDKQYLGTQQLTLTRIDFIDDEICSLSIDGNRGCLQETLDSAEEILSNTEQNKSLLNRYKQLIQYPHFNITYISSVSESIPDYVTPLYLQKLYLYEAYISYQDDPETLIYSIHKDAGFWRMLLSEANDLLSRMIANKAVARNTAFLSGLIATDPFKNIDITLIDKTIRPLNPEEIDISKVFVNELMFKIKMISALKVDDLADNPFIKWDEAMAYKFLMQKNATLNMAYDQYNEFILLASMPGNDYYQHIKDNDYDELHKWSPGLHLIYNPGGKILMAIGAPAFERYISRTHDLAAYMNLVGLQFELSTHSSDPENTVANSKFQNLYTGDPMELDIDNRIISLDCLTNATTCSVSF